MQICLLFSVWGCLQCLCELNLLMAQWCKKRRINPTVCFNEGKYGGLRNGAISCIHFRRNWSYLWLSVYAFSENSFFLSLHGCLSLSCNTVHLRSHNSRLKTGSNHFVAPNELLCKRSFIFFLLVLVHNVCVCKQ